MADVSEKATGDAAAQPSKHTTSALDVVNLVEASDATQQEHALGFIQAVKLYPKACFWSFIVSLVIIMEGYDTALIGSLYGFPAFQRRFGFEVGNTGTYQIQPKWQTALGLSGSAVGIVGIFLNTWIVERIGHKKTLLINLFFLIGCIFIVFFAQSIEMLFAGELLCGIPWGIFTTLAPVYASEVAPVALRAYLETYVVLCWGFGQLLAYAVLDSLETNLTNWAWRIPFAVQWVWPVIIIPLIFFCPESPWWLVRQGRMQSAEKSIRRLTSFNDDQQVRNTLALMVETTELERQMTAGASYLDCFRGTNLWRTEVSCCVYISEVLVGFALTSYANYFFEQAGLSSANSYKLTVGQGGLNVICTLLSCFITGRHGRRNIFIAGCTAMATTMFIIGFLSLATETPAVSAASAAMYMLWFCLYLLTLGPISYIIIGEVSSTRLRAYTIALGRNAYNLMNIISTATAPFILNPTADNWKGKSGFLAGGLGLVAVLWGILRLPETKDRTYEELDILFTKNLKPWQFKGYDLDRQQFIAEKWGKGEVEVEHVE
jgi:SP family general alpha glucoside:H+ symporter-like MFS transporter